jgi:hypothetical protein
MRLTVNYFLAPKLPLRISGCSGFLFFCARLLGRNDRWFLQW